MKINAAGTYKDAFKLVFKSIRTDKKAVEQLKKGEKPIIDNNRLNICQALNNLSAIGDRKSIEFLLDVADNLAYGQGGNQSEFKEFLDEEGFTPSERENTNWSEMLQDTIKKALALTTEDKEDLEVEYNRIFGLKKELTPEQKKLIELRNSFTSLILGDSVLEDSEVLSKTANVRKNLDYFIASSEIPSKQKEECLEKLIYFMSDDYKITPQLKEKKLQVVDEMLNDMIIKTPENDTLTIGNVNQRQTGMCGAISICRKAVCYEDKSRYVDLILEELKDSPTMSVFDVTELGSGKKIDISKTPVNYDSAIKKGYRIIDAAAHNWMHASHASGDGSLQTEYYIPFDEEDYDIYNDSSWILGLEEDFPAEKELLQTIIKENEILNSLLKNRDAMKQAQQNIAKIEKDSYTIQSKTNEKLREIFFRIFPEKSNAEQMGIINSVKEFYKGSSKDNEANVPSKLPKELKEKIVSDFIISSTTAITEEQASKVKENAPDILAMVSDYTGAEAKLKKAKRFNTPRSKFIYKKQLYKLAAAHRLAIEANVNMPDGIARYQRSTGIKQRDIQIVEYLKELRPRLNSEAVLKQWADKNGRVPSRDELEKELTSDTVKMETIIPQKLDEINKLLFQMNTKQLVAQTFTDIATDIKAGNSQLLENIKKTMLIDGETEVVVKKLQEWSDKINNSDSEEDMLEGMKLLGFDDRLHFSKVLYSTFMQSLMDGIPEEEFNYFVETFGGEDKVAIGFENVQKKMKSITEEYSQIQDKWSIPSSRTLILQKIENKQGVLSREKLNKLKKRFDAIESEMIKNESIANTKERQNANSKLYKFTEEENDYFDYIEKNLPSIKKFCKAQYQLLNKELSKELGAVYSSVGMLNGQFWVREEGSSGLATNEQIRIFEQMTGNPYHMETDVVEAAKQIKEGEGSGIQCLSVEDYDYGFHAQYIPAITTETFTNPMTGEKTQKEIMWTDNSWGNAQKEYYWNGRDGFLYTDYGQDMGWKNGFILAPDQKIGLPVQDIFGAIGNKDGEDFGLFTDVVLPGAPSEIYQKLLKMFVYILDVNSGEKLLSSLEGYIKDGVKIKLEELEALDGISEQKITTLTNRIKNEIKSEADFDKLSDDDELKFIFKKLSVFMSTNNPSIQESIYDATTNEELEEIKYTILETILGSFATVLGKSDETILALKDYSSEDFNNLFTEMESKFKINISPEAKESILFDIFDNVEEQTKLDGCLNSLENYFVDKAEEVSKEKFKDIKVAKFFANKAREIISKNIDENIRIKSLDSPAIKSSPYHKEFISAIDKYLKPSSDAELLTIIQTLQMMDFDIVNKLFQNFDEQDLGIKEKKPYDCLLLVKSEDSKMNKEFYDMIANQEISKYLVMSKDDENLSPEELYRSLYVKLSELDVQKYIKAFKAEAFQKYKVREAFPNPVIVTDDVLTNMANDFYKGLSASVDSIRVCNNMVNLLTKYEDLKEDYIKTPLFQAIMKNQEFELDDKNKELIEKFVEALKELKKFSSADNYFNELDGNIDNVISSSKSLNDKLEAKKFVYNMKKIMSKFNDFETTGLDISNYLQQIKEEKESIKNNLDLLIGTNILPKYKNDAYNLLNQLITLYVKNADEKEITELEDKITKLIIDKNLAKNPTVLLNEYVKTLQSKNPNSEKLGILRGYLVKTLVIAQQTKIQYKLVQNQHEGISSKIKDMLPLYNVTMSDGTKYAMDSDVGMLYLIEQLSNTGDNYTTLNLFLEQSGLSDKAVEALIDNFEFEKIYTSIDDNTNEIKSDLIMMDKIQDEVSKYFNMRKGKSVSIEDELKQLNTYISRKLKNYSGNEFVSNYLKYLGSIQSTINIKDANETMIIPIVKEMALSVVEDCANDINMKIKFAEGVSQMLLERYNLITSIKIIDSTEVYDKRTKFFEEFENIQQYIMDKQQELYQAVQQCKSLGLQ